MNRRLTVLIALGALVGSARSARAENPVLVVPPGGGPAQLVIPVSGNGGSGGQLAAPVGGGPLVLVQPSNGGGPAVAIPTGTSGGSDSGSSGSRGSSHGADWDLSAPAAKPSAPTKREIEQDRSAHRTADQVAALFLPQITSADHPVFQSHSLVLRAQADGRLVLIKRTDLGDPFAPAIHSVGPQALRQAGFAVYSETALRQAGYLVYTDVELEDKGLRWDGLQGPVQLYDLQGLRQAAAARRDARTASLVLADPEGYRPTMGSLAVEQLVRRARELYTQAAAQSTAEQLRKR